MSENIKDLMTRQAKAGRVAWIGLRPHKKANLTSVSEAELLVDGGLKGDHYQGQSGDRHLTLIQGEHLRAVGEMLGKELQPGLIRRNVVVSGINLLSFKDQKFAIGDEAILQMTGPCHPCSRMEENLGLGGYNAMRGHGGITARVIREGRIRVSDAVTLLHD